MGRVLIIHTGGTLGMRPREPDQALAPGEFGHTLLEHVPELRELAEIEIDVLCNLDSSDITSVHWMQIGQRIAHRIEEFDGFVITHGTDAMSYTAAALSFLLRNLPKPVILTGSQRPLADARSDGRLNLVGAVDLTTRGICEVGIYLDGSLLRGNRARKTSSFAFEAFSSPNFPPLAQLGAGFRRLTQAIVPSGPFRIEGDFDSRVASLRLLPGANTALLSLARRAELRGLVIQAFGVGNLPVENAELHHALRELVGAGIVVALGSQAEHGRVDLSQYAGGRLGREIGLVGTADMTIEATCVKLMYLLGTLDDVDSVRQAMTVPIAGELTLED